MYKHVTNDKKGVQSCIEVEFCILLKLSWYQFSSDCHKFRLFIFIFRIATKKISLKKYTKEKMEIEIVHY